MRHCLGILAGVLLVAGCSSTAVVHEEVLCQLPGRSWGGFAVTPKTLRWAWQRALDDHERQQVVVVDGKAGPVFESIRHKLCFSPDEKHFAYIARTKPWDKWAVVKDGVVGAEYDHIAEDSFHFDTRNRIVYIAATEGSQFLVVDGEETLITTQAADLRAIEGNGHVALIQGRDGAERVVVDGKPGPAFDQVLGQSLSIDSGTGLVAYPATKGGRLFVAVGEKVLGPYDQLEGVQYLTKEEMVKWQEYEGPWLVRDTEPGWRDFGWKFDFLADGGYAFAARKGGKWSMIVSGRSGPEFDEVGRLPSVSHDRKHFAYSGRSGKEWYILLDGRRLGPFENVGSWGIVNFSEDDRHVAYVTGAGKRQRMIADGLPGPEFDEVYGRAVFSRDGKRLAYGARDKGKGVLVVDGRTFGAWKFVPERFGFSDDGRHFWAMSQDAPEKWSVMIDGRMESEGLRWPAPPVIFRGGHYMYIVSRHVGNAAHTNDCTNDRTRLVVDGCEVGEYERIQSDLAIGDDGKILFLALRDKTVLRVTMELPSGTVRP